MVSSGLQLHTQAEEAREQDKHLAALKLLEGALLAYQQEKDYNGFVKALQSRVLTYKHLFLLKHDAVFAILAQKNAEASLVICRKFNLSEIIDSAYFRLGEVAMLNNDFQKAIEYYEQAVAQHKGLAAEKGDYRYHLGEALYRSGKKEAGKAALLQGLKEIQAHAGGLDPFIWHVWESGAHMKLAELLREDAPEEAREHLQAAQKIVDKDKKLVIRKRQLTELTKKFV